MPKAKSVSDIESLLRIAGTETDVGMRVELAVFHNLLHYRIGRNRRSPGMGTTDAIAAQHDPGGGDDSVLAEGPAMNRADHINTPQVFYFQATIPTFF